MNVVIITSVAFVAAIAYLFGRVQGENRGIDSVMDNVRGTGRCFTQTEVVVGHVVSWEMYQKNQIKVQGTVDGVAMESRNANSKHEAAVKVSGTHNYKHPFLNRESDA